MLRQFVISCILVFTVLGCDELSPTEPSVPPMVGLMGVPGEFDFYLFAYEAKSELVSINKFTDEKRLDTIPWTNVANATFLTPNYTDVGIVNFRGIQLPRNPRNVYGAEVYFELSSAHTWEVQGAAGVGGFIDSIAAPKESASIIGPPHGADVSLSKNLKVSWTPTEDPDDFVAITMTSDVNNGSRGVVLSDLPDNGEHTLTPDQLARMGAGKATLMLSRGRYRAGENSVNQKYLMMIWSQLERQVRIVN
jgi:hypothetical protein